MCMPLAWHDGYVGVIPTRSIGRLLETRFELNSALPGRWTDAACIQSPSLGRSIGSYPRTDTGLNRLNGILRVFDSSSTWMGIRGARGKSWASMEEHSSDQAKMGTQ